MGTFLASALPPAGTGRGQADLGSLTDAVPLALGQGPEDVEDQLAAAGGGVDLLGQAPEAAAPLMQVGARLEQVAERARPSRSGFQTTRVSPWRTYATASSRPVRSAWAPLAVSVKRRLQPACSSACFWSAKLWSCAETRA